MKLVFVSSTFKDMQFERDLLQTYAIPILDSSLHPYGEKAYFGDLRWGVNTTDLDCDEGCRKVLQVCLDQIDNCKPYMIVLIGERYGWIPAQTLIDEACVLKGIEKIRDISVTELEIDYGALLDPDYEGRIFFYFRNLDKTGMTDAQRRDYEPESQIHLQKVEALKRRIQEVYPEQIRYYDAAWDADREKVVGLEAFLTQVEQDLSTVLLRDLATEKQLPWQERSMAAADRWFREESKNTSAVSNGRYSYIGSGTGEVCSFYLVTGPKCSGKTVWIADAYTAFQGEKLGFAFGLDEHSRSAEDLAGVWLYKLETMTGNAHQEGLHILDMAERIVQLQEEAEDILHLYIDNAGSEFLSLLALIERACCMADISVPDVFLAAAVQEKLPFYPFFEQSRKVELTELTAEDASQVLDDIIRSHHKELSDGVKAQVLSKTQSCSAAYLKSIVKRLMILDSEDFAAIRSMGDGMDNINRHMISIIDQTADDREDILLELIEEAKDRLDRTFVDRLMGLFARVPVGLNSAEIRDIFGTMGWEFTDLNFSLAAKMLEDVVRCDPVSHNYKLRDPAVGDKLIDAGMDFPIQPVAEYMLGSEVLRPYAFRAAINCDNVEYLCGVLKRSGVEDITDAVRHLVIRDQTEKAIQLLIYIAQQEALWCVELLPEVASYSHDGDRDDQVKGFNFLVDLAERCEPLLEKGQHSSLLELAVNAWVLVAEDLIENNAGLAIDKLVHAWELMRSYAQEASNTVVYRMYLTMLRAVGFSGSVALYKEYIQGEQFLQVFRREDLEEDDLLRLRVYWEYSRVADIVSFKLGEKYRGKAKRIVEESENLLADCKAEDFAMLAQLTEDPDYLLLGKYLYPLSEVLLREEIKMRMWSDKDLPSAADTLHMANAFFDYSLLRKDGVQYLKAILSYLIVCLEQGQELDMALVADYVETMRRLLRHGLKRRDYAELLPFAEYIAKYEQQELLAEVVKRCYWDDPFAKLVRSYICYRFIKPDKFMLLGVLRSYKQQRADLFEEDWVAACFMDHYFETAGLTVL